VSRGGSPAGPGCQPARQIDMIKYSSALSPLKIGHSHVPVADTYPLKRDFPFAAGRRRCGLRRRARRPKRRKIPVATLVPNQLKRWTLQIDRLDIKISAKQ